MEKLGGTAPGAPKAPLPAGLETPEQWRARQPLQRSRTGQLYQQTPVGSFPVLDAPQTGITRMAGGVARMAEPGMREKAGGASDVIRGGLEAATPVMAATGLAAPLETAAAVGLGSVLQSGTEGGLKKLGVPEEYSDLAGDLVGLFGAGVGATKVKGLANLPKIRGGVEFAQPLREFHAPADLRQVRQAFHFRSSDTRAE